MRISRTSLLTLCLAFLLGLSAACQKTKLSKAPEPQNKNQDSLIACEDLNLARDAAWTAVFLRKFVSCASIQNDRETGSLERTLNLIDAMGLDRLQKAMDLLLVRPLHLTEESSSVYPNLSALITLMDRGTHDEQGLPLAGTEGRWERLQNSLSAFRPRPVMRFIMALEDAKALDQLLAELIAWSDGLPPGALAGLTQKLLTDPTVRQDIRQLQQETIDNPVFVSHLEKIWRPHFYPWRGVQAGSEQRQTFFGHAQTFWSHTSLEQQQRWAHSAAAFVRMGLETQIDELLRRTQDLYDLSRSYVLRQQHFMTDLHEFLNQALKTSLNDLKPAMNGLAQIKDNPSYRDAFEEKAGSTYLHQLLEDFLWDGGRLASCSMNFAGMKTQSDRHDPRSILQPLLTPQPACHGRIPLLLYMDETLGLNCRTGVCAKAWMGQEENIKASDLQKLAEFSWNWLRRELQADPFRLKNRQLAYGPIDNETLKHLDIFWQQHIPRSVEELVQFDHELSLDPRFSGLLKKDFLESWYGLVLQKLNTLPDEFQEIWPDKGNPEGWFQKNTDAKLQRAGLGLYAFGPMDQAFARAMPLMEAWHQLQTVLPDAIDPANFSQILGPTRELASQIKNAQVSIKPETEKILHEWPGSISSHFGYQADGNLTRDVQPYALDQLTRDTEDGWMMLARYRDQLPLLTAAADPSRAKALETWVREKYLPDWTASLKQDLGSELQNIPLELFNRQTLSTEDVRIFTLFAAQNWLGVRPQLPPSTRIAAQPSTPVFSRERAPQVFLGIPVLAGSSQTWAGFWAFNSGYFAGQKSQLQNLLQSLPQDAASVKNEFIEAALNPQILTQGRLNVIDREKITPQQKLLLQLQSVSSLYKSRGQHQIMPSLGFDAFCATGEGVGECPFTTSSFASWRRFLEGRILDHFCPFVSGSRFSTSFQKQWRDALGFQDSTEQIAELCAGNTNLPSGSIPTKVWEQNWLTLIQMGRNPQLKTSLVQLPEAIRRLKVKNVSGAYQKFVRFHSITPLWISVANARLQHREGVYAGFRWHAPGLMDHVIAAYNHEVGDKNFTDALKKLGRLANDGANPVFDLINTVTDTYDASVHAQETPTAFLLRLADQISKDPKLIQTTSRLLEKPEDPFAGILLAYTFPQAMKVGVFEDFAWDHPSYRLMRQAFKSENRRLLFGLVAAFDRLSPKLWKIYQDAAGAYPNRATMAADTDKILRFTANALLSADGEGELSKLWRELLKANFSEALLPSFIRLIHQLREPLVDLNNTWQPSLMTQLDSVIHTTITSHLRLMTGLEKLAPEQSFELMLQAWRGLTTGLLVEDGTALWALLQDKRLGLGDKGIILEQMRDPSLRADLRLVLRALWSLNNDRVLAALDEWENLAISTQKVLHYFEKNVQWRGVGAVSYQYFIKTLDRQLANGQKNLREQLNLLRHWLRPEQDTQTCHGGNAAC